MPYISGGSGGSGGISGVTVTGTGASGKVPVASSASAGTWAFPPGFEIGYAQITAAVNVVSTTEATGTTIISPGALTFDGAAVLCHFQSMFVSTGTTAASDVIVSLFEGATQIARIAAIETPTGSNARATLSGFFRFTPTAASHTYTITAFTTNATGTPAIGAGAGGTGVNGPAFVRFTKV